MKRNTLATVWACTRKSIVNHGETEEVLVNPIQFECNIQTDFSALESNEFGESVNEMVKLRVDNPPNVHKGDHIYTHVPVEQGGAMISGTSYAAYTAGEYRVEKLSSAFVGVRRFRNPSVIYAVKNTV